MKHSLLALLVLHAAGLGAQAPVAQGHAAPRPGDRLLGAWLGASFYSPVGTHLGATPDRDLFLAGLRAEWVLEAAGPLALASTMDLIPMAVVTRNPEYRLRRLATFGGGTVEYKEPTGRGPVYGAGLSPLGLKLYLAPGGRARLYAAGAAGALWFTRDMPVPNARRFNYAFEYGGGVELARADGVAFVLGYKFHHLSNLYTAPENPGLDGNVVYVGLLRRRG